MAIYIVKEGDSLDGIAAAYGAERGPGEWRGPPKMAPPGGEAKGIKTPRCDWPGEGGPGARPLVNALMSEFTE